jgi:hypothetical protein
LLPLLLFFFTFTFFAFFMCSDSNLNEECIEDYRVNKKKFFYPYGEKKNSTEATNSLNVIPSIKPTSIQMYLLFPSSSYSSSSSSCFLVLSWIEEVSAGMMYSI